MITWQWAIILVAALAAAVWDIRTGRIPNILTLGLATAGIIVQVVSDGLTGLGQSVLGWIVAALPYMILFVLGRGGAGDAKMMGAIGAWLGIRQAAIVLGCVAMAGGVLAILRILCHSQRRGILHDLTASLYVYGVALAGGRKTLNLLKSNPMEQAGEQQKVTIPYGVAIFLGVCLAASTVHLWMR